LTNVSQSAARKVAKQYAAKRGYADPVLRENPSAVIIGSYATTYVNNERQDSTYPIAYTILNIAIGSPESSDGKTRMNERNAAGIRLALAKATGSEALGRTPAWAAVIEIPQIAA
jgi:hypothetical protein